MGRRTVRENGNQDGTRSRLSDDALIVLLAPCSLRETKGYGAVKQDNGWLTDDAYFGSRG